VSPGGCVHHVHAKATVSRCGRDGGGAVAPPGLQGFSASLSLALTAALSQASPPIRGIPGYETLNRLNEKGLAADYTEMISAFARSDILDRERLQRIGSGLGTRYVLQPGLAEFSQSLMDRFELIGLKLLRSRTTTLRLWLRLWDAETGQMLWESAGETTVAIELLREQAAVPLTEVARALWLRVPQPASRSHVLVHMHRCFRRCASGIEQGTTELGPIVVVSTRVASRLYNK